MFGLQGPVSPSLGAQPLLEFADLSGNLLSGPIDAFTSEIVEESRLHRLILANNRLTGPVSGMDKLGTFRDVAPSNAHLLNISGNNFEGELPLAFYAAASVGGPAKLPRIDVRPPLPPRER